MRPFPSLALILCLGIPALPAQQGAEQAFREGTAAFAAERFEEARELLERAALTDVDNPEVFLWLGRARYELGDLDAALRAWRRTLELAPDEPLALRMVAVLTGRDLDGERRLQLAEELLGAGLLDAARRECLDIRQNVVLDAGQRARLMLLSARVELDRGNGDTAARELRALIVEDPTQDARPEVQLALGRAELLLGGEHAARGRARLERLASEAAATPAGVRSRLELLRGTLRERSAPEDRAALQAWIEAHGEHPLVVEARRLLLDAHLRAADAAAALEVAATMWPAIDAASRDRTARQLLGLLQSQSTDDTRAAIAGLSGLRALGLGTDTERDVVRELARLRARDALARLDTALRVGATLDGAPTQALEAARASLAELRDLDRQHRAVAERLGLAAELRALAARAHTARPDDADLHPCDRWSVELALDVARDTPTASAEAAAAVATVVDAAQQRGLVGLRVAVQVGAQLAAVLDQDAAYATWSSVQRRRIQILDALAREELRQTLASGAGVAPREATDTQRALVTVAIEWARRDLTVAKESVTLVTRHAEMLVAHDRPAVASALLTSLAQGLPPDVVPLARSAAVALEVDAILQARWRLAASGLPVPATLAPEIQRALEQLYSLEDIVATTDLAAVRALRARIVDHFRQLDQFAAAEQAILVRGDAPSERADTWAELRLAHLRNELAVRELNRVSPADGPPEISPAFRAALDAYVGFLTRRATDDLAPEAVDAVLGIATRFEQRSAHTAAIAIYQQLATALGKLTAPAELRETRAAQAAFAAAAAADARARQALAESAGPDLTEAADAAVEAALTAYREFSAAHPRSPLLEQVLPRQLDLGLAVARNGAWAAAERVFDRLIEDGVRRVDQLEFCRALCRLGPAFEEHALALLATSMIPAPDSQPGDRGLTTASSRESLADALEEPAPATGGAYFVMGTRERHAASLGADSDRLLQTVRQLEQQRAQQIAALRGPIGVAIATQTGQVDDDALTRAEIERIRRVFDAAYTALLELRREHPDSPYAEPARGTVLAMVDRWRALARWSEAAELSGRFLRDEPRDRDRDTLQLGVARDLATFASRLPDQRGPAHAVLREVSERFDRARAAFDVLIDASETEAGSEAARVARWEHAATFLAQARTIAGLRTSLARGRYVRAARELAAVASAHPGHPEAVAVPNQLWAIGEELIAFGFHDEAVAVRRELWARHPTHPLADQAAMSIAQLYRGPLGQPLRAAELLQELNFAHGGADPNLQEAILAVGLELHGARRWVEALHVLENFVDSFPRHARAGEALTRIGEVHQANGAYRDAIAAYRRVIAEYPAGQHVSAARWAIAECWIHQSEWRKAMDGYVEFQREYAKDDRAAEAGRRIDVLKSLVRYQQVVDETGQRKAFDAQYQIASIVREQLYLPRKAISEFGKVSGNWPESHLADDALFEVGATWLGLGETADARVALAHLAEQYPQSPLADDALYLVGKSFEDEADRLGTVTRADSARQAQEVAQREAYGRAQGNVRRFRDEAEQRISDLKKEGKLAQAEDAEAALQATSGAFRSQNVQVFAEWASNEAEVLTAAQLVDREDRIRAALRRAVAAYDDAARVAGGDKAGEALLRMARIQDVRLEDSDAAMATWLEIVRQFSGTAVAEDASWKIAQFHDRRDDHGAAIEAYQGFLRNYRRSPNAGAAQAAIAENYELLGEWVHAMDAYTNYINNFPDGPLVGRAREQIAWIKTYRL